MKKVWIGVILAALVLGLSLFVFADAGIEITAQPTDIEASIGETGTATVTAEADGDISYQWYYCTANGSVWQESGMPGAQSDTIRVQVTQKRLGQKYKCVLTDEKGESVETAVIAVVNADRTRIVIDGQPDDIVAKLNSKGSATVAAHAEPEAELRYQWYFQAVGSEAWQVSGMEGCDTPTVTVPVIQKRLGQQYKCVITTADGGREETRAITLCEPDPDVIRILQQPADIVGDFGSRGSATVAAESDLELSYQWYFKGRNSTVWKPSGFTGNDTATIIVPAITEARINQQYKCVITASNGATKETEPIRILKTPDLTLTVTQNPNSFVVLEGQPILLSVAAKVEEEGDYEFSYQWYQNDEALEGADKSELVFLSVEEENAGSYRCVVSVNGVTAESRTGTVEVLDLDELLGTSEPDEAKEPELPAEMEEPAAPAAVTDTDVAE